MSGTTKTIFMVLLLIVTAAVVGKLLLRSTIEDVMENKQQDVMENMQDKRITSDKDLPPKLDQLLQNIPNLNVSGFQLDTTRLRDTIKARST